MAGGTRTARAQVGRGDGGGGGGQHFVGAGPAAHLACSRDARPSMMWRGGASKGPPVPQ